MARAKFQTNQLTPDEIAVVQSLESLANSATNERLQKVAGVIVNTSTGDVVGPATSTDNTVPRWNGTDNKTLQASTVSISDGGVLTLGANGVSGFDAISYQQLQDALAGLKAKQSVVAATTANGTMATDFDDGSTVDGVTLTTGDRILIKNQTASELNGIYIVAASGAPTRSSDADTWDELVSAYVYVEEGTTNADKGFICTINSGGTLGTDPVTWTGFSSSGGGITSLNALTDASQTFATGTTGTDFGISSAAGVHTFNIPDASGSARGVITTGAQTIAGAKTFSNAPVFSFVTASQILKVDAGKALTSGLIALGSEVSGTLPIANGGTNSTTALNNNRFIVSSGSAIVEHGAITASRALVSDANGLPAASATTATELGYLSGVTSAVQTQLGTKVPYTGASSNVDLGSNSLTTSDVLTTDVQAQGSSGIIIKNSGGTAQAEFGSGGGTNATINGTTNMGTASADYHQIAGGTGTITDTATGSSTDININLVPKGAGRVQAGGNNVYYASGTDVALADGGTGASLTDPNADRIMFWDDSAGSVAWLTAGTGLTITDTTIAASGGGTVDNSVVSGRLTLQSGQPVMIGNVEGASAETLYYTPYKGNTIALYYNSAWTLYSTAEISMSLSGKTVSKNHDIWAYYTGSAVALDSTVWTDDTNRATALTTQDGVLVKTGDATRRYLGTIRMTGTANRSIWLVNGNGGETAKLFVYNQYNQVPIMFSCPYTTSSWTLTTASWREFNASSVVRAEVVCGYNRYTGGLSLNASLRCTTTNSRIALTIYRNGSNMNPATEGYSLDTSITGLSGEIQIITAQAQLPPELRTTGYAYYSPVEIGGTGGTGYGGLATASGGQTTGIWGSVFM